MSNKMNKLEFEANRKSKSYRFQGSFAKNSEGMFVMNLMYGYENHAQICKEDAFSTMPFESYILVHQIQPKEGDVITHIKSGRKFLVGADMEGFITHLFPLIEDGVIKAYLRSEDYYKD